MVMLLVLRGEMERKERQEEKREVRGGVGESEGRRGREENTCYHLDCTLRHGKKESK